MRLTALGHRHLSCTQDRQGSRRRNWEPPMGAIDPAVSIDDSAGQDPGFSQQLQANTTADDIHNRIDSTDLVKMNLLDGEPVNFAFSDGDAVENRHGFFLYPGRKSAGEDQLLYFCKGALMCVGVMS